jgi:hypothetical protein
MTITVLNTLHTAGLALALTPERGLRVTPASSLTPPLRELIKAQRDDLVRWLGRCASNDPASPKVREPQTTPAQEPANWKDLDRVYQAHHIACPICIAAGKGYGLRCGAGTALWVAYDSTDWGATALRHNKGPTK